MMLSVWAIENLRLPAFSDDLTPLDVTARDWAEDPLFGPLEETC